MKSLGGARYASTPLPCHRLRPGRIPHHTSAVLSLQTMLVPLTASSIWFTVDLVESVEARLLNTRLGYQGKHVRFKTHSY